MKDRTVLALVFLIATVFGLAVYGEDREARIENAEHAAWMKENDR